MKRIVLAISILLVIVAVSGAHAFQISLRPMDVDRQVTDPTFYPLALYDVGRIAAIQSPAGWHSLEGFMDDLFAVQEELASGKIYRHFRVAGNAAERAYTIAWISAAIRDIDVAMGGWFASGIVPGWNGNGFSFPIEGGSAFFDDGGLDLTPSGPAPIPEPATLLLLGIGLTAAGSLGRIKQWSSRKKRKSTALPATS